MNKTIEVKQLEFEQDNTLSSSSTLSILFKSNLNPIEKQNTIFKYITYPIELICKLTIPSFQNQFFQKTKLRSLIIFISILFCQCTLQNTLEINFTIFFLLNIIFLTTEFISETLESRFSKYLYEFLSIISCICWMQNAIYFILDIFLYFSVLLDLNGILLAVFLIAVGNQMIGKLIRFL